MVLFSTQNIWQKLWVRKYLQFYSEILCSQIVHTLEIQLVPELLLLVSDTLYTQCRQNEHLHKKVGCLEK